MLSVAWQLVPYALLATLSPLGFAATLTVMRAGRLKALGFAVGVMVGQLAACSVLVLAGGAVIGGHTKAHSTALAVLELGLALVLTVLAFIVHRRPEPPPTADHRSKAGLERLQRVRVITASGVGVLLGIGGPKRLVLTALAAASITTAGIAGADEAVLTVFYGLLATTLVWLSVLAYLVFGTRTVATLDAAQSWLSARRRPATVYALVIAALGLFVSAVLQL